MLRANERTLTEPEVRIGRLDLRVFILQPDKGQCSDRIVSWPHLSGLFAGGYAAGPAYSESLLHRILLHQLYLHRTTALQPPMPCLTPAENSYTAADASNRF